jgi:hypothetical protein
MACRALVQPPLEDLAGRVKALLAARRAEAAPGDAGGRRDEAEEPATARIHRRAEEPAADGALAEKVD